MDILRAAARNASLIAVKLPNGVSCSYGKLLQSSQSIQADLQKVLSPAGSGDGPRIGIFAEPGLQYVAATWASWLSGGIAVPLAVSHPEHELDYIIRDAGISAVLTSPSGHDRLKGVAQAAGATLHVLEDSLFQGTDDLVADKQNSTIDSAGGSVFNSSDSSSSAELGALIVYTSGTTGRPKGALHTHGSLSAQMRCLTDAWQWSSADVMAHALPLHHVHGVINGLYCAHYVGATVHLLPKFSPAAMWKELQSGDISVLMAVPTMYNYLLSNHDAQMSQQQQAAAAAGAARLRLAVCGSAAAPVALLQRWQALSGQVLLERYGMTETGMVLSNPYQGERRAGFVGVPLPGVEVKVVQQGPDKDSSSDDGSRPTTPDAAQGVVGELAVRGPMLFREYWGRPEATAASFDEQGYFLTGDTVSLEGIPPYYRILGRSSVDIIKSGGYKLSALDIEGALLQHSAVAEAAVVGLPDELMGQVVTALIYPTSAAQASGCVSGETSSHIAPGNDAELIQQLQGHCRQELAAYAVPRHWKVLDQPLPRNAMGKVNKKQLIKTFFPQEVAAAATTS